MNWQCGKRVFYLAIVWAAGLLAAVGMASAQTKAAAAELTVLKSLGTKSAPITMEVFTDFECPSCRALYEQTLRQVFDNYVVTGKAYYIHRDFPLPMHKYSRLAARYANAAARIGRFEKVEQALFARRDTWAANGGVDAAVASVLTPAEMKRVRQLVQSGDVDAAIEKDIELGRSFQVNQTPTMIITCRGKTYPIVGVISYQILRQFFEQLLRQ